MESSTWNHLHPYTEHQHHANPASILLGRTSILFQNALSSGDLGGNGWDPPFLGAGSRWMCPTGSSALPPPRSVTDSEKHVPKAVPKGNKNKETHVSGCATAVPHGASKEVLKEAPCWPGQRGQSRCFCADCTSLAVSCSGPSWSQQGRLLAPLSFLCHPELASPLAELRCVAGPSSTLLQFVPSSWPDPLPEVTLPSGQPAGLGSSQNRSAA